MHLVDNHGATVREVTWALLYNNLNQLKQRKQRFSGASWDSTEAAKVGSGLSLCPKGAGLWDMTRALRLECTNALYQITIPGDGRKDAGTGLVVGPLDLHGLETDEVRGGRGEDTRSNTRNATRR